MNQKSFVNIVLIVLVVVLAGVAGYFALIKKQESTSQPSETANWNACVNTKYGYEVKYPPTWKVWKPGAPEARLASCDENLAIITLSPDIDNIKSPRLTIDVYDDERLRETIYKGSTSLDDYFAKNPEILRNNPIIKEDKIGGERLVWLKDRLLSFRNGSIFELGATNIDDKNLKAILEFFKFSP